MTPKDQSLWEISEEWMDNLFSDLRQNVIPKDYEDMIKMIRRTEYKRGKSDGRLDVLKDEEGFMNYLIEYPELCREKCKERLSQIQKEIKEIEK